MKIRSGRSRVSVIVAATVVSTWAWAWPSAGQNMDTFADIHSSAGSNTVNAGRIYLNGDAGAAILQNMTSSGNVIQYRVGPRVDVGAGYNLTDNIAVELQGGFAHNDIYQVNGVSWTQIPTTFWTVPVMANGIYKYRFSGRWHAWQAYGGLGAGAVISTIQINRPGNSFNSTDCVFGYQAMLGIKYVFTEHAECGVGYNFLGSLDHNWTSAGVPLDASPTYMHSFLLTFSWRF